MAAVVGQQERQVPAQGHPEEAAHGRDHDRALQVEPIGLPRPPGVRADRVELPEGRIQLRVHDRSASSFPLPPSPFPGLSPGYPAAPWHFLNFLPLPQGHGSLRPTPVYGLATTEAPTAAAPKGLPGGRGPPGGSGPVAVPLTSPSAAALLATIGAARRRRPPPSGPVTVRPGPGPPGDPGGGPISMRSLSQRSASVLRMSCIRPTNIS